MSMCPACDRPLHAMEEIDVGRVVLCPDCKTPLEVLSRDPVELVLARELTEGDWAD